MNLSYVNEEKRDDMAGYKKDGAQALEAKCWMDEVMGIDLDVMAQKVLGALAGANYTVIAKSPETPKNAFLTAA
jgi:hypothetical protein